MNRDKLNDLLVSKGWPEIKENDTFILFVFDPLHDNTKLSYCEFRDVRGIHVKTKKAELFRDGYPYIMFYCKYGTNYYEQEGDVKEVPHHDYLNGTVYECIQKIEKTKQGKKQDTLDAIAFLKIIGAFFAISFCSVVLLIFIMHIYASINIEFTEYQQRQDALNELITNQLQCPQTHM